MTMFPKPGVVRLEGADLTALRWACYLRDGRRCVDCAQLLRFPRGYWDSMHMAHVRTKKNNGDSLDNVRTKCLKCHAREHAGGKPCPPKGRL